MSSGGVCGVECGVFFFFKQKTAYEVLRSLVGSEMCIRDRRPSRQSPAATAPATGPTAVGDCSRCGPLCGLQSLSLIHI